MPIKKYLMALASGSILVSGFASGLASAHSLPLGDGKVTTSGAKKGYVYSCLKEFPSGGKGAFKTGSWLDAANKTWDPSLKPVVDGSVKWDGKVSFTLDGDERVVSANGLPSHETGNYPIAKTDDAYQYDRNPNRISEQDILMKLPANPEIASSPTCLHLDLVGFAVTGVAIYNALDALGRDAPAYEIQDKCDGHPERSGEYHYHNLSACLTDTKSGPNGTSDLLGYALDGFGIYGKYEDGKELTTDDLDECHGRVSSVMWDGEVREIYHYVFTEDYPYTVGCYKGAVPAALSKPPQKQ